MDNELRDAGRKARDVAELAAAPGLVTIDTAPALFFDRALVDLDGVTYRGSEPIPYAAQALDEARRRGLALTFVTNNASREPEAVAAHLAALDIPAAADDVMTAAQACARHLGEFVTPGAKVLVVGGQGLRTAVAQQGYTVVTSADDAPEAVAQGYVAGLGWTELAEAAYAVGNGAVHVASNLDMTLPTDRGIAPGNGSLVAAVVAATGVQPHSAGKPSPAMYAMAVDRSQAQRPLVVGDRLDTDLAGARSGGYVGFHVLTGVSDGRDDVLSPPGLRPHLIAADLRGLLRPHRAPAWHDGWWTSGQVAARVQGNRLEISERTVEPGITERTVEPDDGADLIRVACAAAWAHVDSGRVLASDSVPELTVATR